MRPSEAPPSPAAGSPAAVPPARGDDIPFQHPLIRAGQYAWALVGLALALVLIGIVVREVQLVVIPLILALFPAALLEPVMRLLRRAGVPSAIAALVVILSAFGLLYGLGRLLAPQIADEVPALQESVEEGLVELQAFLEDGPFGIDPVWIQDSLETLQDQVLESDILQTGVMGAAGAVAQIGTIMVLMLVVLFFYMKDGARIAAWARDLFPRSVREDVGAVGQLGWTTIGAYFRGQLLVAFFDAVFIGIGLAILQVPLALPLAVLVFFGGLFPIVGAVIAGAVAVLVALASGGWVVALIALGIVLAVQQIEGNVLAPLVLGKATEMHPLAVLTSLTAGGILLGVLGAFIAVPIAASLARAIGYLRARHEPTFA
jgi:predicted PurR-regulated permease PerM